ncbi:unnamed protein product [Calypogeia fissa]
MTDETKKNPDTCHAVVPSLACRKSVPLRRGVLPSRLRKKFAFAATAIGDLCWSVSAVDVGMQFCLAPSIALFPQFRPLRLQVQVFEEFSTHALVDGCLTLRFSFLGTTLFRGDVGVRFHLERSVLLNRRSLRHRQFSIRCCRQFSFAIWSGSGALGNRTLTFSTRLQICVLISFSGHLHLL